MLSVTAASMASLMAMPRLPGVSGMLARMVRPALVRLLGLAMQFAPHTCIISLRKGFCSKLMRTMKTLHSRPIRLHAKASALPHCPAPVSVVSRLIPNCLLYQAWGTAVLGLWLPAGLTLSSL